MPHAPQLVRESAAVSVQPAPGQHTQLSPPSRLQKPSASAGPHAGDPLQAPATQVCRAGQELPHPPQFSGSSRKWAQAPFEQHTPSVPSSATHTSATESHWDPRQLSNTQLVPDEGAGDGARRTGAVSSAQPPAIANTGRAAQSPQPPQSAGSLERIDAATTAAGAKDAGPEGAPEPVAVRAAGREVTLVGLEIEGRAGGPRRAGPAAALESVRIETGALITARVRWTRLVATPAIVRIAAADTGQAATVAETGRTPGVVDAVRRSTIAREGLAAAIDAGEATGAIAVLRAARERPAVRATVGIAVNLGAARAERAGLAALTAIVGIARPIDASRATAPSEPAVAQRTGRSILADRGEAHTAAVDAQLPLPAGQTTESAVPRIGIQVGARPVAATGPRPGVIRADLVVAPQAADGGDATALPATVARRAIARRSTDRLTAVPRRQADTEDAARSGRTSNLAGIAVRVGEHTHAGPAAAEVGASIGQAARRAVVEAVAYTTG